MKTIIQKAIEGGWHNWEHGFIDRSYHGISYDGFQYRKDIILDPLFWQSLGKVFKVYGKGTGGATSCDCSLEYKTSGVATHIQIALRFHELNLTEGWDAAIKYLSELLSA